MRLGARAALATGLACLALAAGSGLPFAATETADPCERAAQLLERNRPSEAYEMALTGAEACGTLSTEAKAASDRARDLLAQAAALQRRAAAAAEAEAAGDEPADGENSRDLREQAQSRYAAALAADLGLQDALDALTSPGADSAGADYSAARALLDNNRRDAAEQAALEVLKKTGTPPADPDLRDLLNQSQGERFRGWLAANPWSYAVVAATLLLGFALIRGLLRERFHLAATVAAKGGPEGAVAALDASVRAELRRLQVDHGVRFAGPADAEQRLPEISTAPGWWNDAWKIWHWTQRRRTSTVTVTLADVGAPAAVVTVARHNAVVDDSVVLRLLPDDPHAPAPVSTGGASTVADFEPLVPLVAAWIAYTISDPDDRQDLFGTEDRDAWMWQARGNAALAADKDWATTRQAARARWQAAVARDANYGDAHLALAVLDTTEPDPAGDHRLDETCLAEGMADLQALINRHKPASDPAGGSSTTDPAVSKRRLALVARARYNLLIGHLNWVRQRTDGPVDWSQEWENPPAATAADRDWRIPSWDEAEHAIHHWMARHPEGQPAVAGRIRDHVRVLKAMHGPGFVEPKGSETPSPSIITQSAYLAGHGIPEEVTYRDAHAAYSMACFWADRSTGSSSTTLPQLGEDARAETLARARESRAQAERLNGRLRAFSRHDPFLKPLQ